MPLEQKLGSSPTASGESPDAKIAESPDPQSLELVESQCLAADPIVPPQASSRRKPKLLKRFLLSFVLIGGSVGGLVLLLAAWLPSTLGCGQKARLSEAKHYLGAMNRAQMAFYLEKGRFATSLKSLDSEISPTTSNFQYSTQATSKAAFSYGLARNDKVKSYVAATFVLPQAGKVKDAVFTSIICEATVKGPSQPGMPSLKKGSPVCPEGTIAWKTP